MLPAKQPAVKSFPRRSSGRIHQVSKGHPCVRCEGDHKCTYTDDGLIFCGRHVDVDIPGFQCLGQPKNPTWKMYRLDTGRGLIESDDATFRRGLAWLKRQEELARRAEKANDAKSDGVNDDNAPSHDWAAESREYRDNLGANRLAFYGQLIGVPVSAAIAARIGFKKKHRVEIKPGIWKDVPVFTNEEVDAEGRVIGIAIRTFTGLKPTMGGSNRGLTLVDGWDRGEDSTIFVVEGPTDSMAVHAAGLSVIGRFSNVGGAEFLAKLLANYPSRKIVILGENDGERKDGKIPGVVGATTVASNLANSLGRQIFWALPPTGFKDTRCWFTAQIGEDRREDPDAWRECGREFEASLVYEFVSPVLDSAGRPIGNSPSSTDEPVETPDEVVARLFPDPPPGTPPRPVPSSEAPSKAPDDPQPTEPSRLATIDPCRNVASRCPRAARRLYEAVNGDQQRASETHCRSLSCEYCHELKKQQLVRTVTKHLSNVERVWMWRAPCDKWDAIYRSMTKKAARRHVDFNFMRLREDDQMLLVTSLEPPKGHETVIEASGPEAVKRMLSTIGRIDRYGAHDYAASHPWTVAAAFPRNPKTGQWTKLGGFVSSMATVERIIENTPEASEIRRFQSADPFFPRTNLQWRAPTAARKRIEMEIYIGEKLNTETTQTPIDDFEAWFKASPQLASNIRPQTAGFR